MKTAVLIALIIGGVFLVGLVLSLICIMVIAKRADERIEEAAKDFEKNFTLHDFERED